MSHKLFIRLKNSAKDSPLFEWLIIFDDGKTQLPSAAEKNELLKYAETAQQIIVLVPSVDIFITQVKLPKLSPTRLAKAIPFALEDQITEDPAKLHFAVSTSKSGEPMSVAAVNRETMLSWQSILKNILQKAASKVKILLPDVLALPWEKRRFHILIDQDLALVRTDKCLGFAIETKELYPVLSLLLKRPGQVKPELIQIDNPTSVTLFTKEEAALLGTPIQMTATQSNPLLMMSESIKEPVMLNLLQGNYAPAQKRITMDQLVRAGVAIVCAWMVFVTIVDISSYFVLYRVKKSINDEVQTIYARVYPNTLAPENPKASLQKELDSLRISRSDSSFIRLLNTVGPRFASLSESGLSIKSFSYQNSQLLLNVEANDSTILDDLRKSLESQGLKVVVSNAERSTSGLIEARLTVEEMH